MAIVINNLTNQKIINSTTKPTTKKIEQPRNVVIFSYAIAKKLIQNGFKILDIERNDSDNTKIVFFFKNSERIKKFLKKNYNIEI